MIVKGKKTKLSRRGSVHGYRKDSRGKQMPPVAFDGVNERNRIRQGSQREPCVVKQNMWWAVEVAPLFCGEREVDPTWKERACQRQETEWHREACPSPFEPQLWRRVKPRSPGGLSTRHPGSGCPAVLLRTYAPAPAHAHTTECTPEPTVLWRVHLHLRLLLLLPKGATAGMSRNSTFAPAGTSKSCRYSQQSGRYL